MGKATDKQIQYCNDLIESGAPFHLKMPHEASVSAANAFIQANKKYAYLKPGRVYLEAIARNGAFCHPSDIGAYNH